nr:hypothetical protein [Salinisphaera sp.]
MCRRKAAGVAQIGATAAGCARGIECSEIGGRLQLLLGGIQTAGIYGEREQGHGGHDEGGGHDENGATLAVRAPQRV